MIPQPSRTPPAQQTDPQADISRTKHGPSSNLIESNGSLAWGGGGGLKEALKVQFLLCIAGETIRKTTRLFFTFFSAKLLRFMTTINNSYHITNATVATYIIFKSHLWLTETYGYSRSQQAITVHIVSVI